MAFFLPCLLLDANGVDTSQYTVYDHSNTVLQRQRSWWKAQVGFWGGNPVVHAAGITANSKPFHEYGTRMSEEANANGEIPEERIDAEIDRDLVESEKDNPAPSHSCGPCNRI